MIPITVLIEIRNVNVSHVLHATTTSTSEIIVCLNNITCILRSSYRSY